MSQMTPHTNHQKNISQNHTELPLHTFRMAMMKKIANENVGECGEKEILVQC